LNILSELGLSDDESCAQKFEKQIESADSVSQELISDIKKMIIEHYKVKHLKSYPDLVKKLDSLDESWIKKIIKNADFEEVEE
jgi:hypothetical protein